MKRNIEVGVNELQIFKVTIERNLQIKKTYIIKNGFCLRSVKIIKRCIKNGYSDKRTKKKEYATY